MLPTHFHPFLCTTFFQLCSKQSHFQIKRARRVAGVDGKVTPWEEWKNGLVFKWTYRVFGRTVVIHGAAVDRLFRCSCTIATIRRAQYNRTPVLLTFPSPKKHAAVGVAEFLQHAFVILTLSLRRSSVAGNDFRLFIFPVHRRR